MKKLVILMLSFFCFFTSILEAQKFMKYQAWASEKYRYTGSNNDRIENYDSIKFVLKGFWNYRLDNNIPIPSLLYIKTDAYNFINFYTIESQGYRTQDPLNPYDDSRFVNHQEGTKLDTIKWDHDSTFNDPNIPGKIDTIHIYDPPYGAYTKHPTVFRWIDDSSPRLFPNPANLQYAVSGNFIGDGKSEILMFYYSEYRNFKVYLASNSQLTDTLNYNFQVDSIYNFNGYGFEANSIKFVVSGDFDGDGMDEVLILKDRFGPPGIQDIYMLKYSGGSWNYSFQGSINKSAFDFAYCYFVVPGDFDGNGYCDIADTNRQVIKRLIFYTC